MTRVFTVLAVQAEDNVRQQVRSVQLTEYLLAYWPLFPDDRRGPGCALVSLRRGLAKTHVGERRCDDVCVAAIRPMLLRKGMVSERPVHVQRGGSLFISVGARPLAEPGLCASALFSVAAYITLRGRSLASSWYLLHTKSGALRVPWFHERCLEALG